MSSVAILTSDFRPQTQALAHFYSFSRWFQIWEWHQDPLTPLGGQTPRPQALPPIFGSKNSAILRRNSSKCSRGHLVSRSQKYYWKMIHQGRSGFESRSRQFSLFHVLLQICRFSPFFMLLLFTLPSKGRRKKQGGNYGQIFPKIALQKIFIEMQN